METLDYFLFEHKLPLSSLEQRSTWASQLAAAALLVMARHTAAPGSVKPDEHTRDTEESEAEAVGQVVERGKAQSGGELELGKMESGGATV